MVIVAGRSTRSLGRMNGHRVIGGVTLAIGVLSIASTVANVLLLGAPPFHWITISNLMIAIALITGGALLWAGAKNRYAVSVLAWVLASIAGIFELGTLLWASSRGASIPWAGVVVQTGYVACGLLIIGFLLRQVQRARGEVEGGMSA